MYVLWQFKFLIVLAIILLIVVFATVVGYI